MIKKINLYYYLIQNFLQYNLQKFLLFFFSFNIRKLLKNKKTQNIINGETVVIFGSGKIVNELTEDEKEKISKSKIIFMNKNLIFWKYIGIWPNFYFLADTPLKSEKSLKIFNDTLKTINDNKLDSPVLLLERFYKYGLPNNLNCTFFNYNKSKNLKWALNLNDIMFGHHGSLTTLLNLIDLLNLGKKIMLVGFDMNGRDYFFEKDKDFEKYTDKSFNSRGKLHPNAEKIDDKNIFTYWEIISKNLRAKKIKLYCNNQESLLVKNNLVEYISIDKFYEE